MEFNAEIIRRLLLSSSEEEILKIRDELSNLKKTLRLDEKQLKDLFLMITNAFSERRLDFYLTAITAIKKLSRAKREVLKYYRVAIEISEAMGQKFFAAFNTPDIPKFLQRIIEYAHARLSGPTEVVKYIVRYYCDYYSRDDFVEVVLDLKDTRFVDSVIAAIESFESIINELKPRDLLMDCYKNMPKKNRRWIISTDIPIDQQVEEIIKSFVSMLLEASLESEFNIPFERILKFFRSLHAKGIKATLAKYLIRKYPDKFIQEAFEDFKRAIMYIEVDDLVDLVEKVKDESVLAEIGERLLSKSFRTVVLDSEYFYTPDDLYEYFDVIKKLPIQPDVAYEYLLSLADTPLIIEYESGYYEFHQEIYTDLHISGILMRFVAKDANLFKKALKEIAKLRKELIRRAIKGDLRFNTYQTAAEYARSLILWGVHPQNIDNIKRHLESLSEEKLEKIIAMIRPALKYALKTGDLEREEIEEYYLNLKELFTTAKISEKLKKKAIKQLKAIEKYLKDWDLDRSLGE